ncbi:choline ABC transporter substrate-binding protein [Marinomonas sp. 15G1-11]|uniref:Choline ABC transporter substrate-binding protein n=1 Tax=Marinomonas phaeophyticola TaxID=3004091 RepID=A0ABT4JNY8_9GAMM|nr:choline ABC transporter substrate-binding protein [Marinomonas sp. 15G1-11]MCZ2720081.1 choline ABC transporter substrate-binding protein [Marinomonas sp. 15G1-11]
MLKTSSYVSFIKAGSVAAFLISSSLSYAQEPIQCQKVTFSDPGWTDIGATNGITTTILNALGYETNVLLLGVPIGFESLKSGEVDLFMGNWMPAQTGFINEYKQDIDIVRTNLEGVKFTLAVPEFVYDAGVKNFADLNRFSSQFRKRIYGIEAGAPANQNLQKMIDTNDFNLGEWKVVESGEQAMLSQVNRSVRREQFIVFLGWEPHPMNVSFNLKYLAGGDEYFGPNYGGAIIRTLSRKGYGTECSNVGQLVKNLEFSLTMENEIIDGILNQSLESGIAAATWLKKHPEVLEDWLDGVTTFDGEPGLAAVQNSLGLK